MLAAVLLLPLLAVVLPLLRECFVVSLPKSLLCAVKTEESLSRSHERLLRRDDYIDYVCDYLVYVDYFLYITTPHVSKSAIPTTTTTLVFFFQDSCSIPGN